MYHPQNASDTKLHSLTELAQPFSARDDQSITGTLNSDSTALTQSPASGPNADAHRTGLSRREAVNAFDACLPEYLKISQVAGLFQVEDRTVQEWTRKGYLPVIRIGHTTRYKRSDVEAFVAENFRVARRSAIGGGL
jgi:excisionase family DNA binding protein